MQYMFKKKKLLKFVVNLLLNFVSIAPIIIYLKRRNKNKNKNKKIQLPVELMQFFIQEGFYRNDCIES